MSESKKIWKVLCPVQKRDGTKFWMRVGSCYQNRDGSQNLYLNAFPTDGNVLQIRELDDRDFQPRNHDADANHHSPSDNHHSPSDNLHSPSDNLPF